MHLLQVLTSLALLICPVAMADSSSSNEEKTSKQKPQFHNDARHMGADPHVIWDANSGQYYAYSTEGADEGYNFAIYSSPDLSTWHRHPGGVLKACRDSSGNPVEGGQACWARDWYWAPETYHNEKTGWYFFFFAGRLREDLAKDHFRYSAFEEPSKLGVAVSRSPTGPFKEIKSQPIDYYPFDPDYYDVNLIMDEKQMLPPQSLEEGHKAPRGTYIPHIDVNIFFDDDDRIYLYVSRNAYRNWNWDKKLGKYIEESNIIMVEMERDWWDDPTASTMPEIIASQRDIHAKDAPELPANITSYNGTGEIGDPQRKDGWKTVISYGADPQEWENFHVDDYAKFNGQKKDRRWSEGSTLIKRKGRDRKPVYMLTYSANNYEASNYGVGFATAESPFGPFKKSNNNPVLSQKPDGGHPIYSTGHGSIVASPPRHGHEHVGAQDVTLHTPDGAELFYIHHGRNDTERARSMYTTRMEIHDEQVFFGSDDAVSMSLTALDQALPKHTYPIKLDAGCSKGKREPEYTIRVVSKTKATFDLSEGSNRIIGRPGDLRPESLREDPSHSGSYQAMFGGTKLKEIVYQRLNVDGAWVDVTSTKVHCR